MLLPTGRLFGTKHRRHGMAATKLKSLRAKFVRTMLAVTAIIGLSTLAILVLTSVQTSKRNLASVERYIEEGITSKGKVLTENHALALRSLTVDNAFLDMQRLVERAVAEEADLAYGLYVTTQGEILAYSRRGLTRKGERPADEEVLGELGQTGSALHVGKTAVQRTSRFGEDLLEVAVPVAGEDGEVLGTIRYGLSTRRMHEALARAQGDAKASLVRSVLLVGFLISLASGLGLLLSRLQGARIIRPIVELTGMARELASGNRAVRVKIESGDELQQLGASFNHMALDLDASYGKLEEMNRTLEHKVEERTTELALRNRDMRLVLDNVDQGFATLSPEGRLSRERSRVLDEWFGTCDEPLTFWHYISPFAPRFAASFRLGWEQLVEDFLPIEVALSQLPQLLHARGKSWQFRYLPIYRGTELEGILLVVADITVRLAKEAEEAEYQELMESFKRLVSDRSGLHGFLREAEPMVEAIVARRLESDPVVLNRALHTLKGNAASMGLSLVAGICHRLESQIAESGAVSDAMLAELSARWSAITRHIQSFVGKVPETVIEVAEADYTAFVARLSGARGIPRELLHELLAWRLTPVERPLQRLAEYACALAGRLDKGEIDVRLEPNGVRLDAECFKGFFSELVHVIRNAVDHGIESPAEREAAHKSGRATLTLKSQLDGDGLTFEVADDGPGIDWQALAAKGKSQGLPHSTPAELLAVLCHDGITTRTTVTSSSGRGVGMAAFKQKVEAMHGRIEIESTRGSGARFIIHLPCSARDVAVAHQHPRSRSGDIQPAAKEGSVN
jgi:two-component system, chemotaxis family, sensor kinase CheA